MKPKLLLLMLLFGSMCFAQAPTDYYANYPFTNGLLTNQADPGNGDIANGNYTFVTDRFGSPNNAMDCENTRADAIFSLGPRFNVTVSFWVKMDVLSPSSTTGDQRVIDLFENATNGDYIFFKRTSPTNFEIEYQVNSQNASSTFTSSALETGQWCHIVLQSVRRVYGNGTTDNQLRFYLNGDFQNATSTNLNLVNTARAFQAGANLSISRASNFPGLVDDIQLFNRTLSGQEVTTIYNTSAPCTTAITIPDANFKAELLAIPSLNFNGNNEIDCFEARNFDGTIDVRNKNIADLTGIEAFTRLRVLNCSRNPLTSINLSANSSLVNITCNNMPLLTSLNVANGMNGVNVTVGSTSIANLLDATASPNLSCIQHDAGFDPTTNNNWAKDTTANWSTNCFASSCTSTVNIPDTSFKNALLAHGTTITGAGISVIDTDGDGQICTTEAQAYNGVINVPSRNINDLTGIEAFTNITKLICYNNQLTSLNVTANTALTELYCTDNQLASLNVSANTALTELRCHRNNLTSIDISANTSLSWLSADSNQLTSANLANGNNSTTLSVVNVSNNTNLSCIQHDTGFDPTTNNNWTKDAVANWSTNCPTASCTSIVNIPDTNFKNALLAHGTTITGAGISVIDTDGDGEICTTEAQAYSGTIDVANKSINDLTGIAAFTNATVLYANSNQLTTLDVSNNTSLTTLYCNDNQLTTLDISANTALTVLYAFNNELTSLNVANGNNSAITIMRAEGNPSLSCIQHDSGFTPPTTGWQKDTTASWSTNCNACTTFINIPDTNFKNALLAHGATQSVNGVQPITGVGISVIDTNGDGEICPAEAQAYTGTISVVGKSISNLSGIESFTNITNLDCGFNQLRSIDVSSNTSLTTLEITQNQISSIDVSSNTALTTFLCDTNQLISLDVSSNTNLQYLNCQSNTLLSTLNVANGNNTNMTVSATNNTNLTCIQHDSNFTPSTNSNWTKDATANWSTNCPSVACTTFVNIPDASFKAALLDHGVGITGLGIYPIDGDGDGEICITEAQAYRGNISVYGRGINDLTGIEAFINLRELRCYDNNLTSIDISANTNLRWLSADNNQLTSANLANGVNATALSVVNLSGNTSLTCIQHDTGFDPTTNNNWTKDAVANWSTNCPTASCTSIVNIPDTNFKNALLDHGTNILGPGISVIDTDGDGEICATEATAYNGVISVPSGSINDLTGIEAFTNITELRCNNNQLTSIDVSANTALLRLYCNNNQLSSLNVSTNTALLTLDCKNNLLTNLDVSANTALIALTCDNNQITSLNASANTALTTLYCHNNQLTSLNVANGNNSNLNIMSASNNSSLNCIQHDAGFDPTTNSNWIKDTSASWSINCAPCASNVNIPDANFKNALLAHGTTITGQGVSVIDTDGDGEICDVEAQVYTGTIDVPFKNISDLTGIEAFTNASILYVNNNQLTSLDVSNNLSLETIYFSDNSITQADLSLNTNLTRVYAFNNQLNSLNVANGNNSNMNAMRAQGNPNLTCIQHDTGFDPTAASDWIKDASANWSANCGTPDTVAPTVATQNITVQLDANGNATITPQQIDNGSTDDRDAIADLTFALSKTTFDCSNIGANTVTLTVTDTSSNSATATATVTVEDVMQPTVVAQNITAQLNASGNVTITPQQVDNSSTDNCSIASMSLDKTTFDCSNIGANQVVLTVVDANGNSNTATATVTVEDSIAPTAVAQDISVQLGTNGQVSVTPAQINNGSSDNCTSVANLTYSLSKTNFTCNDLGANNVTLTVADASGNQSTATAVVTVSQNPNAQLAAVTQDITVQLDANGQATITPQQINNGSGSGCNSNPTLSLDKTTFDCSNVGANTVTLTVTDGGNSVTGTAIVTVQDATQPTIIAQDITVQLDTNGQATISTTDIDNGSSDNCSIASMSLDTTSFTCANLGANQVVLTVVDANGNSNTATATVTVEDSIVPTAVAQDISVQLGANNQVTITPAQINNGSSDNCTSATNLIYSLDKTNFTCSDLGTNTVTLTVEDASGNQITATAVVTVTPNPTAPLVAVAQNITVQLDANGSVTIQPSDVDNGSGSGCNSNPTLSLDKTTFDCSNMGANTVILTATDGGATETATAIVTVEDTMAPTVNTKDVTVTLSNGQGTITVSDVDDNSTDNCSVASTSLDTTSFTCANLGTNTVTLTVTDGQGNVATGTATVTVVETATPIVVTQNITVALDASGAATITPQQVDNGSSDACSGIASMSLDTTSFQCPDLSSPQTVTLTVTDNSGNTATGTATVTFTAPDEDNDGISDACDTREVVTPKGFSPNGDGQNDTWTIENIEKFPNSTLEVFNRWGEKVYQANNYQNNWDGTSNQKGGSSTKLPAGAYYYIINLNDSEFAPVQGWLYINY